jgi:hypothetical protein
MSTVTSKRYGLDNQVCFSTEYDQPRPDIRKVRMPRCKRDLCRSKTWRAPGPIDHRGSLPCDKKRPVSARGV